MVLPRAEGFQHAPYFHPNAESDFGIFLLRKNAYVIVWDMFETSYQAKYSIKAMKIKVMDLARTVDVSPAALLRQMEQAGLPHERDDEFVSDEQQKQLWAFVRARQDAETIRENIKLLRKDRGLTRAELARKADFSERQLARIEAGEAYISRQDQKERLAKALHVAIADLCGNTDYVGRLRQTEPGANAAVPIGTTVDTQTRLAYVLLGQRYGWSAGDIIKLAPVLFALLAEGSLERRRRRLTEIRKAYDEVDETLKSYLSRLPRQCSVEEASIERCDLRAADVEEDGDATSVFRNHRGEDPFVAYLFEFATQLLPDDEPAYLRGERRLLARICRSELERLAGDSERARWALEYGEVTLSDIPDHLLDSTSEAKEKRIAWLESKLSATVEDAVEEWRHNLSSKGVRCPKCDVPVDPRAKFCPRCGNRLTRPLWKGAENAQH